MGTDQDSGVNFVIPDIRKVVATAKSRSLLYQDVPGQAGSAKCKICAGIGDGFYPCSGQHRVENASKRDHSRAGVGSSQGNASFQPEWFGAGGRYGIETDGKCHNRGRHPVQDDLIGSCRVSRSTGHP